MEKMIKGVEKIAQVSIVLIKGIIASLESLLSFLLGGGWIAVLIIIVICMIGLLLNSFYGIFFINEINESRTITSVINEINQETYEKIENLKSFYPHDEYVIEPNNINWRNIISVYAVKYSENNELTSVTVLTGDNIKKLKDIYWDMNTVKVYYTNQVINQYETKKILNIRIESKGIEEISQAYKFSDKQKQEINILLYSPNDKLWGLLIYGTNADNYKLVDIAKQQVGNKGGEKFWRWYGFDKRVAWCAIFVSWVANEVGKLNVNIPRFALVSDGVNWYKKNNRWKEKTHIPKAGDIIFFDWEQDEKVNHVGIVVSVENDKVYTVEGNSIDDQCLERTYLINDDVIYGYGIT